MFGDFDPHLSKLHPIWFLFSQKGGLLRVHSGEHHGGIAGPTTGATLVFINPFAIFHGSRDCFGLHGFPNVKGFPNVIVNPKSFVFKPQQST
jgi:hypothetical protein